MKDCKGEWRNFWSERNVPYIDGSSSYTNIYTSQNSTEKILLYWNPTSDFPRGPVVQWLRIHLSVWGTWVWSLVWEDSTSHEATNPLFHSYWAHALEPTDRNYWSSSAWSLCSTTEERPPQRAALMPQQKESPRAARKTQHSQKFKKLKVNF